MTTIAAIQGDGWAVIGADSRITDDGRMYEFPYGKIALNNGIYIAGAGTMRGLNILHHGWKAPSPTLRESLNSFMSKKFIPQMRKAFIDAGYDMKEDGDAAGHDTEFLIAVKGRVYRVNEDYSWDVDTRGVYCSGSGGDYAAGVLEVLRAHAAKTPAAAVRMVKRAIGVAEKFDTNTGGTIHVVTQHG